MFIRLRHRLLQGARLIMWPTGRIWSNWAGRDPSPTVTGTPATGGLGVFPAVKFDGSTYMTYGAINSYGATGKDLSIAFRAKYTTAPSSGSSITAFAARAGDPASAHGFIVFVGNTPGAGEKGWVGVVHGPGNSALSVSDTAGAAANTGKDVAVVFTYNSAKRTATLYVNGMKVNFVTDTGFDFDPWGDGSLIYVGANNATNRKFVGEISYWIVYDRCLGDDEAFALMDDSAPKFLRDEEVNDLYPIIVHYTTSLAVGSTEADNQPRLYATTVDASAAFTGDLASVPGGGSSSRYATRVTVRSAWGGDIPLFSRYKTTVAVRQVYTPTAPTNYRTQVLVSPHYTVRIDGRTDLLDTFRFRR